MISGVIKKKFTIFSVRFVSFPFFKNELIEVNLFRKRKYFYRQMRNIYSYGQAES